MRVGKKFHTLFLYDESERSTDMTKDIIDNLLIDLSKDNAHTTVFVRLGDTRTRTLHITLTNRGDVYDLDHLVVGEFLIKKPDENVNLQAVVRQGNEIHYTLRTQDINVAGECKAQLMLTFDDEAQITTPEFTIMVYAKEVDPALETSMNEYTSIAQMVAMANGYMNAALDSANSAQNYAVASDYSAQAAALSASIASEKALNIEHYADEAQQSATNAISAKNATLAALQQAVRASEEAVEASAGVEANANLASRSAANAQEDAQAVAEAKASVDETASTITGYVQDALQAARDARSDATSASESAQIAIEAANRAEDAVAALPFRFGIEDGTYGYYKAGADSVTPFRSGYCLGKIIPTPNHSNCFVAMGLMRKEVVNE